MYLIEISYHSGFRSTESLRASTTPGSTRCVCIALSVWHSEFYFNAVNWLRGLELTGFLAVEFADGEVGGSEKCCYQSQGRRKMRLQGFWREGGMLTAKLLGDWADLRSYLRVLLGQVNSWSPQPPAGKDKREVPTQPRGPCLLASATAALQRAAAGVSLLLCSCNFAFNQLCTRRRDPGKCYSQGKCQNINVLSLHS